MWEGNPIEECDTWCSIAEARFAAAGGDGELVMEAYETALKFAVDGGRPTQRVDVCRAAVKFCKSTPAFEGEVSRWEEELSRVLEVHPEVAGEESEGEGEMECLEHDSEFETPVSLSETESEGEEGEGEGEEESAATSTNSARRAVVRKKRSKVVRLLNRPGYSADEDCKLFQYLTMLLSKAFSV